MKELIVVNPYDLKVIKKLPFASKADLEKKIYNATGRRKDRRYHQYVAAR